jgi:GTP-binding protein EngB required for normal cell division
MTDDEQNSQNFKAATLAAKFEAALTKLDDFLLRADQPELAAIEKKLQNNLDEYHQQGLLTVAFIGQYSAGKSTIISALTGRRNICIGSNITTDKTAIYDWNGIRVIDTPGLFTERNDHDEITYDAINKTDLLVFCLTYMLFDSLTAENFKKLAYEKGYRWKMMLVINKMSDEAGEEDEKIANYCKSLTEAIKPYSLDEFPLCFIDAKDYCGGVDEKDEFLIEVSRFQTFTDALNTFVKRRGSLAKFDTPVRIALGYIDDTQLSLTRDSNKDSAFFELLNRLSRTVRQERDRLRTKVRGTALRLSAAVANEGTVLARAVGSNADIEVLAKQAESNVQKHCERAGAEMEEAVKTAIESIQEEIQKVLQGDLYKAFAARLEVNQKVSAQNIDSGVDVERLRGQVKLLKDIGERAGYQLNNLAKKTGIDTTGQAFLRASNVAGGSLHHGVYAVGKFLNFNFRPWQAVNIAKNIGNVAKFLGPLLSVGLLAVDVYAVTQEEEQDKKLANARREITSQFISIAKDLESQVEAQLREVEAQVYGEIEKQIATARQQEEEAIAADNKWMRELAEIREEIQEILREI